MASLEERLRTSVRMLNGQISDDMSLSALEIRFLNSKHFALSRLELSARHRALVGIRFYLRLNGLIA